MLSHVSPPLPDDIGPVFVSQYFKNTTLIRNKISKRVLNIQAYLSACRIIAGKSICRTRAFQAQFTAVLTSKLMVLSGLKHPPMFIGNPGRYYNDIDGVNPHRPAYLHIREQRIHTGGVQHCRR
jgi:hypothetical protein